MIDKCNVAYKFSRPLVQFLVNCRLGQELFTLPLYAACCPWSHGLRPKKVYHTRSVVVTPTPVGSLPNSCLSHVSHRLGRIWVEEVDLVYKILIRSPCPEI